MTPILSIVMPTHNRANYAISAIKSILSFENEPIELVVTDTSENKDLKTLVSLIKDDRFRYEHIEDALSMTENYNLAMSLASGEYVCLIGDDDTITLDAIHVANWAKENKIEIVSPLVVANYAWPDFKHRFLGMAHASNLYIKKDFGLISWQNSRENLLKALSKGALGTEGLPKVYHSIVGRQLMEKIKSISGNYFHGVSPDVSGAVALAIVSEKYIEIDYPITIPGAAGKSNSGRSAMNTHKGSLKDDSHTKRFKNLHWPKLLPEFTSVETVWAQAAYETIVALEPKLLDKYNFIAVYSVNALKHRDHKNDIKNAILEYKQKYQMSTFKFNFYYYKAMLLEIGKVISRYGGRIFHPTASGGKDCVSNLENIQEAQIALSDFLKDKNINIKNIVMKI